MSYMRMGWALEYFKGKTKSYVFVGGYPTKEGMKKRKAGKKLTEKDYIDVVQDYGDRYKDNASFCELIRTFVSRQTGDEKYADKIMKVLAKKLRVEHKLRKKPLTFKQHSKEMGKIMKKFNESPEGKRMNKILTSVKCKQ